MSSLHLFLSYRRKDLLAAGIVPRIHERLEEHYGVGKVFMDVTLFLRALISWTTSAPGWAARTC